MKKLLALALALSMALSLAACGKDNNTDTPNTPGNTAGGSGAGASTPQTPEEFSFNGTVTLLCDSDAGTNEDLLCRAIASGCEEVSGVTFVVENVPGGNSATAVQTLKSSKDTDRQMYVLLESTSMALSMLQGTNPYSLDDIQIVSKISSDWYLLVTTTSTGFKTWDDVLNYAKANPGELNWGASGAGNNSNLFFAVLTNDAGIEANYVSYSGTGPARVGLIAGDISLCHMSSANLLDNLREEGTEYVGLLTNRPTNEFEGIDVVTCTELGYEASNAIISSRDIYVDSAASPAQVAWLENIISQAVKTDNFLEFAELNNIIMDYMNTEDAEVWLDSYCEVAEEMIPIMMG